MMNVFALNNPLESFHGKYEVPSRLRINTWNKWKTEKIKIKMKKIHIDWFESTGKYEWFNFAGFYFLNFLGS